MQDMAYTSPNYQAYMSHLRKEHTLITHNLHDSLEDIDHNTPTLLYLSYALGISYIQLLLQ